MIIDILKIIHQVLFNMMFQNHDIWLTSWIFYFFDMIYSIDLFRSIDKDMVQCKLMENDEEIMDSDDENKKSSWIQYLENVLKFIDAPYVKYLYNLVDYFN